MDTKIKCSACSNDAVTDYSFSDGSPSCAWCSPHEFCEPATGFYFGSEMATCYRCNAKFAGYECHCELAHECQREDD